jgi:hypothetical protein
LAILDEWPVIHTSIGNNDDDDDGEMACDIGSANERLASIDNEDDDVDDIKDIDGEVGWDGGSTNKQLVSIGNKGDRIDGKIGCEDGSFKE